MLAAAKETSAGPQQPAPSITNTTTTASSTNDEEVNRMAQPKSGIPKIAAVPLKPTSNINFQPVSTNPGKSRRLKINVLLDATIFVAGGTLHGRLELTCSTSRSIRMGLIEVQLQAYEGKSYVKAPNDQINDKELASSQSFLSSNIVFQGPRTPPSNAVRGPNEDGFWQANKGKTTFPFSFRLPEDSPSSFTFQTMAALKYVITGVVQYEENSQIETMFKSKDAFVVENWKTTHPNIVDIEVTDETVGQLFMGGIGQVTLQGAIRKCFFQSGSDVYVETRVKNDTRRRVQGLKVQLVRKLVMLRQSNKRGPLDTKVIAEPVSEAIFRERDNIYDPGEDRSNVLHVHIPPYVRTVSNTALAEVAVSLQVIISMGMLSKDIMIELPIDVCHGASVNPPPIVDLASNLHPFQYNMIDDQDVSPDRTTGEGSRRNQVSPTRAKRPESPPPGGRVLPWSDDEGDDDGYQSPVQSGSHSASPTRQLSPDRFPRPAGPSARIPKAPTLGPAAPVAYVPATERSRYLTGIPPQQRYRTSRAFSPARESVMLGTYTTEGAYIEQPKVTNANEASSSTQQSADRPPSSPIRPARPLPQPMPAANNTQPITRLPNNTQPKPVSAQPITRLPTNTQPPQARKPDMDRREPKVVARAAEGVSNESKPPKESGHRREDRQESDADRERRHRERRERRDKEGREDREKTRENEQDNADTTREDVRGHRSHHHHHHSEKSRDRRAKSSQRSREGKQEDELKREPSREERGRRERREEHKRGEERPRSARILFEEEVSKTVRAKEQQGRVKDVKSPTQQGPQHAVSPKIQALIQKIDQRQ
ncbi:hypothetical protein SmJEL517_g05187 [Synchytrium microbalum]|uniref:Arrestin C-terminal-like domain-containing protein n=1 Tax=Synchytrium microbalum TaxID=1806994 RepID=A0A507BWJ1_9FUNG|nr:uncharacterized protein SmJEL517_g05187 [Synchytrium microbalum]TPX31481.1 hypothetical protein SmJEL517_g05187 [Synchytrium microbalum]